MMSAEDWYFMYFPSIPGGRGWEERWNDNDICDLLILNNDGCWRAKMTIRESASK
jgi:hypothetical protein